MYIKKVADETKKPAGETTMEEIAQALEEGMEQLAP